MTKYRIVRDKYLGYEVQSWSWWFPFWRPHDFCNTHPTLERAKEYIVKLKEVHYID